MTIYFSPSTGAFYDTMISGTPRSRMMWQRSRPRNTPSCWRPPAPARSSRPGRTVCLVAVDQPKPPPETQAALARRRRDREIEALRWLRERHRDEVALGLTTTLTAEDFRLVLDHIQDLRDVPDQSGFPETIDWPVLAPELLASAA